MSRRIRRQERSKSEELDEAGVVASILAEFSATDEGFPSGSVGSDDCSLEELRRVVRWRNPFLLLHSSSPYTLPLKPGSIRIKTVVREC
jgi:hypothetical protein